MKFEIGITPDGLEAIREVYGEEFINATDTEPAGIRTRTDVGAVQAFVDTAVEDRINSWRAKSEALYGDEPSPGMG